MRTLIQHRDLPFVLLKFSSVFLILWTIQHGHSASHKTLFEDTVVSAKQGDVFAQVNLGRMYSEGKVVKQNDKEAVRWYKEAAEQGNAKAQYLLGYMHRVGLGVPQDFEEAVKWYQKSAQNGDKYAQFALGFLYSVGLGVNKNSVIALSLIDVAISNGYDQDNDTKLILHRQMSKNQIAQAKLLATQCIQNDYQGCG
ncbi:MAG: tetratricopeptide repeat protein [Pseudomonadota bacterium]